MKLRDCRRLACLVFVFLAFWAADAESARQASTAAQAAAERTPPVLTAVNPRGLAAGAAATVSGLLLLVYFYRRRQYILYWVGGWLLVAASMLVAAPREMTGRIGDVAFGVSQFLAIVSALVFVISADAYRRKPRLRRGYAVGLLPVLIWFVLAPLALRTEAAFTPGHLLIGGALGAAGFAHLWLLRRDWLLGAVIVGVALVVLGGLNVWLAFGSPQPDAAVAGRTLFVQLVLYLVIALGMQLMTFEDMTYELRVTNRRLENAQSELRQMVTTDPLTGCGNRRFFDDVIGRELERHKRYRIPLSMLFVDIDRFKAINDTLGHEAGDRVLQNVAAFLVRHVREADYVFRWGGDEFLILISCRESEAISKGAELQTAFAASKDAAALPRGVGLSVGCAEVPASASDVMAMVKLADERMYVNKRGAGEAGGRLPGGVRRPAADADDRQR